MIAPDTEQQEDAHGEAAEMLFVLARQVRAIRSSVENVGLTLLLLLLAVIAATTVDLNRYIPPGLLKDYGSILLLLPLVPFLLRTVAVWRDKHRTDRRLRAIFRAGYHEARPHFSSAAIGPLLEILNSARSEGFFSTLLVLLKDLLGALRLEDAVTLTKDQRKVLHSLLDPGLEYCPHVCSVSTLTEGKRRQIRPVVLRSLGLLGNQTSIPLLERFALQTKEQALQDAALFAVGQIYERQQYGAEQLLRAGYAPERSDMLLRPLSAAMPQGSDPQQLLRVDSAHF